MKQPDARDPRNLSAFERQLLESARREPLPAALKQRMASALEPTASAALSGIRPALRLTQAGRVKLLAAWLGPGVLVAGLAGWYALGHRDEARRPQPSAAEVSTPPAAVALPAPPPAGLQLPLAVDSLADEIALLDRARAALRGAAPAAALRVLAEYRERFAHGALGPEAEALQIEALLASGAKSDARRLGVLFLSSHPEHPWAPRVRQLLGAR